LPDTKKQIPIALSIEKLSSNHLHIAALPSHVLGTF